MIAENIDYEKLKQYVDVKLHVVGQNTRSPESIKRAIAEYHNEITGIQTIYGKQYKETLNKTYTIYKDLYPNTINQV